MSEEKRSPDELVEEQAGRVGRTLVSLERGFTRLLALLDRRECSPDAAAEVITRGEQVARLGRDLADAWQRAVLEWLRESGHREVTIGERQYYGTRVKHVKLLDHVRTGRALFEATAEERVLSALHGDAEQWDAVLAALEDWLKDVVSSSSPYKDGAARKVLEAVLPPLEIPGKDGGEPELRDRVTRTYYRNPPSAEDLEQLREAEDAPHWIESWPERLDGSGTPKPVEKLGIAHLRFVAGRGGGSKKELGAQLTKGR